MSPKRAEVQVPSELMLDVIEFIDAWEQLKDADFDSPPWDAKRRLSAVQRRLWYSVRMWQDDVRPVRAEEWAEASA